MDPCLRSLFGALDDAEGPSPRPLERVPLRSLSPALLLGGRRGPRDARVYGPLRRCPAPASMDFPSPRLRALWKMPLDGPPPRLWEPSRQSGAADVSTELASRGVLVTGVSSRDLGPLPRGLCHGGPFHKRPRLRDRLTGTFVAGITCQRRRLARLLLTGSLSQKPGTSSVGPDHGVLVRGLSCHKDVASGTCLRKTPSQGPCRGTPPPRRWNLSLSSAEKGPRRRPLRPSTVLYGQGGIKQSDAALRGPARTEAAGASTVLQRSELSAVQGGPTAVPCGRDGPRRTALQDSRASPVVSSPPSSPARECTRPPHTGIGVPCHGPSLLGLLHGERPLGGPFPGPLVPGPSQGSPCGPWPLGNGGFPSSRVPKEAFRAGPSGDTRRPSKRAGGSSSSTSPKSIVKAPRAASCKASRKVSCEGPSRGASKRARRRGLLYTVPGPRPTKTGA
ncbi:hypothetical protein M885DRAFT_13488 [Pelagophyceae sp. CCMP2097]|nr:hypothetical protein M885DRAFT_13488 [Pelagophyceae sp. CCMP2097]|mmetsp:Transcript_28473/g.98352  ORF Transcript_28473/g.98352 Transcript_28473/m.98352 type:complete len:448 (-) Transcript_28473:1219-2562(-)